MDDAEYVITNLSRIRLYEQNGIMPGINLILTMETRQQPINLTVIKQMIRTYGTNEGTLSKTKKMLDGMRVKCKVFNL